MDKNQNTTRIRDCPCLDFGPDLMEGPQLFSGFHPCLGGSLAGGGSDPFSPTVGALASVRQGLAAKGFWPTRQNQKTRATIYDPAEMPHEAFVSKDCDWGPFWSPFWIYKVQCDDVIRRLIADKGRVFYLKRMFFAQKPIETRHPYRGAWLW